jgi:hypothetical protein
MNTENYMSETPHTIETPAQNNPVREWEIGYWAYGHYLSGQDQHAIWIVVESDDRPHAEVARLAERAARLHRQGKPLPPKCHLLDLVTAERAYRIGERRWGERWYDDPQTDASRYDSRYDLVLQIALLGEIRYG